MCHSRPPLPPKGKKSADNLLRLCPSLGSGCRRERYSPLCHPACPGVPWERSRGICSSLCPPTTPLGRGFQRIVGLRSAQGKGNRRKIKVLSFRRTCGNRDERKPSPTVLQQEHSSAQFAWQELTVSRACAVCAVPPSALAHRSDSRPQQPPWNHPPQEGAPQDT